MGFDFGRAESAEEVEAVQRLRYAVYVEEVGRYRDVAGGSDRRFAEPEDGHSWIFYARDGNEIVAATRMTWGADGFSERQVDQYQLAQFLDEIPPALMAVGERASGLPSYRGTGVLAQMMQHSRPLLDAHDPRPAV